MKKNLFLAFPLILLSACNGSDSNSDKVAKSTFDAVTAELEQANKAKDELDKKNKDLAGQLNAANITIVTGEDERKASKTALDAALVKLEQSITAKQETETALATERSNSADFKKNWDESQEIVKARDEALRLSKIAFDAAVIAGEIDADGKSALKTKLEAAETAQAAAALALQRTLEDYEAARTKAKLGPDGTSAFEAELETAKIAHEKAKSALTVAEAARDDFKKKYDDAVKEGKIGEDGKSAYVKELEDAGEAVRIAKEAETTAKGLYDTSLLKLAAAEKERDDATRDLGVAIAERDKLRDALTRLVANTCQ